MYQLHMALKNFPCLSYTISDDLQVKNTYLNLKIRAVYIHD